jgi:5-methylcytosine-specific restriction enzyme A
MMQKALCVRRYRVEIDSRTRRSGPVMVRHGAAWLGGLGEVWHVLARRGLAVVAGFGNSRQGVSVKERRGWAWRGGAWNGRSYTLLRTTAAQCIKPAIIPFLRNEHMQAEARLRGRAWMAIRKRLITANPFCQICNKALSEVIDHIIPLARGGTNKPENLQAVCKRCNEVKGTGDTVTVTGLDGWPEVEWRVGKI